MAAAEALEEATAGSVHSPGVELMVRLVQIVRTDVWCLH
jgi:hypothetical protein